jgi:adenylate cyclase
MSIIKKKIIIGLSAGLITTIFSFFQIGELLELKGYDIFHLFKKTTHPPEDIVIVAIDEPSFAEIGKQWPWPRSIHAKLIDVLKKEGASVIGFDILFSEPSQLNEDTILADSIKKAGNVCLASDIEVLSNKKYIQEIVIEPLQKLKTGAFTGLVSLYIDRDNIVREFYSAKEDKILFADQIARIHSKEVFPIPENALISYVGPPGSFTTVSYYQALNPSVFLPENFFTDKIVIVGMLLKSVLEPGKPHPDTFATPFLISKNRRLMSGVEIQANMVYDFLRGTFITRLNRFKTIVLFLIIGLVSSFLQLRWRPVFNGLLTVLFCTGYLATSFYILQTERLWTPTLSIILPFLLSYAVFGIDAYIQTEKKRRELKRAFSHYLSPTIIETVLHNPENLKLGGEKVEATILFSDIANFTKMSEMMPPEEVSRMLNRYFDEMVKIIFQYNGTVDKFIGDAVMAFWGAPLTDPDHALNACRTAIAMQERLKLLREEMKRERLPDIYIRIGINTGVVIVGNMGSSELFSYTVLGDTVNLAQRLETANKEMGTSIIISKSVYKNVAAHVKVQPLGIIHVKGKTEEVEIYELISVR